MISLSLALSLTLTIAIQDSYQEFRNRFMMAMEINAS